MEDLDAASAAIPDNCKHLYTLDTLSSVLAASLASYSDNMYVFSRSSDEPLAL